MRLPMNLVRITLLGAVVLLLLAGCDSQTKAQRNGALACTLIGCSSGAQVDMTDLPLTPGPKSLITLCVDKTCSRRSPQTLPLLGAEVDAPYKGESDVTVRISVTGPDGTVLASASTRSRLHRIQPNGSNCQPTCFITRLKLTASGNLEQV